MVIIMAKTKNKKRPAQKKTQTPAIQKSEHLKKYTAQKNKKNETKSTEDKSSITQILFGHPKINKKDIIEISIMITLIAFLIFMDLKVKEII